MKKIYTCKSFSYFGNKRFFKEKKRQKKYKKSLNKKINNIYRKRFNVNLRERLSKLKDGIYDSKAIIKKKDFKKLVVPEVFSLKENIDEMLEFYNKLDENAKVNQGIELDLSHIKDISADALLYTLSVFDYYKQILRYSRIKGNLPTDKICMNLIIQSGFLDYFYMPFKPICDSSNDIIKIKSGSIVQSSIIDNVLTFAETKLGLINDIENTKSQGIYSSLVECMNNTVEHAYDLKGKWWLISLYNNKNNKVNFTFLDNGLGIPKTVKKKFFRDKLLSKIVPNDANLIKSTLEGEFRTKTEDAWRGKGLPSIYNSFKDKRIENLTIISNYGFLKCDDNKSINLKLKFRGTLLNLDLNKN